MNGEAGEGLLKPDYAVLVVRRHLSQMQVCSLNCHTHTAILFGFKVKVRWKKNEGENEEPSKVKV